MQVKIRHSPPTPSPAASSRAARSSRSAGRDDRALAGVVLTAGADGGVMKGLKRKVLGGESFFITTYTAPPRAAGSMSPRTCSATSSRSR